MYSVPNYTATLLVNAFNDVIADDPDILQYSTIESETVPYAIIRNATVTLWSGCMPRFRGASDFRKKKGSSDIAPNIRLKTVCGIRKRR